MDLTHGRLPSDSISPGPSRPTAATVVCSEAQRTANPDTAKQSLLNTSERSDPAPPKQVTHWLEPHTVLTDAGTLECQCVACSGSTKFAVF